MLRVIVSFRAFFTTVIIVLFATLSGIGQSIIITGKVVNAQDNAPLSFVNVLINNNAKGTTTNIDGFFSITVQESALKKMSFNYAGFAPFVYHVKTKADLKPLRRQLTIKLYQSTNQPLQSTVANNNSPASAIIKRVYQNRKRNNPKNLKSYKYNAYHKFYINLKNKIPAQTAAEVDSSNTLDSTEKRLAHYLRKHHLFLSEAVTQHQYIFPNYYKKTLQGNRISGVQNSVFLSIDQRLQPFSFYKTHINVFGKKYLNPISHNSDKKYSFEVSDTLFIGENSIYVIHFYPLPGKNFEALKGVLYINTKYYAIQNVVFEPVDQYQSTSFRIQQEYHLLKDKYWFPVQLSANIIFHKKKLGERPMVGTLRTFLKDIELYPPLRPRDFSKVTFEVAPKANNQTPDFWKNQHQAHPLSPKDTLTYTYIDSVSNHRLFNHLATTLKLATYDKLSYRSLDFKVSEMIQYNGYEGIRLGAHFSTNEKISEIFKGTGYVAYGTKDGNFKYGASMSVQNIFKRFDPQLGVYFSQDVTEPADLNLLAPERWSLNGVLRQALITRMDKVKTLGAYIKVRPFRNLQLLAGFKNQQIEPTYHYEYLSTTISSPDNTPIALNEFNISEVTLGLRYAYRESFMKKDHHEVYLGSQYPVIQFNYKRGLPSVLNSEFDYYKIEGQAAYSFCLPTTGTTTIRLQAGMIQGETPYPLLYNGRGGLTQLPIMVDHSFQVMGLYEFVSDRFFNAFISQNLGRLLYRSNATWFQPELILVQNIGFGTLTHVDRHQMLDFKTMEQGYFESGVLLDKLLRINYYQVANLNIGTGVFYRYGTYTKKGLENFALKVTLGLSF
ncbi:DUF5686 family protein [uncultured Microscilla sp.]|uniref:DUF5686 family protein n=1 Tax=uncultured Microscilla sp. TaxID=432653 RepID=UPI002618EB68|nr:DUF5686 family protein [uncultured Microscilla sp.]